MHEMEFFKLVFLNTINISNIYEIVFIETTIKITSNAFLDIDLIKKPQRELIVF